METPRGAGVVTRAAAIIARPGRTWEVIADEPPNIRALFLNYAAPLAAIPAVCGLVGALIFGFNIANVGVHMSLPGLLLEAVAGYVTVVPAIYGGGVVADLIVRAFGGRLGRERGVQVLTYAATPFWLAGLAQLYPSLGLPVGVLAALYSLYVFYAGLAALGGLADDRRLTAFAAILIALAVIWVLRGMVVAYAAELGGPLSASYAPLS
jgi:hypothetical protein